MTTSRHLLGLGLALLLSHGCYGDHGRGEPSDAAIDPSDAAIDPPGDRDGGSLTEPCVTTCEPATVVARVPLDPADGIPAALDAVVHREELVVAVLAANPDVPEPTEAFSLVRISPRTGDVRSESVDAPVSTEVIGAGALVSRGETLTLLGLHDGAHWSRVWPVEPMVLVASWEGAASDPTVREWNLTEEPMQPCAGCWRGGAAAAFGDMGMVALPGDGELFLGRVGWMDGSLRRERVEVPTLLPTSAIAARGASADAIILALGGLREALRAVPSPGAAIVATGSGTGAPISVPGSPHDHSPHPWPRSDGPELVRFVHDEGLSSGRLHRFALEGSGAVSRGTITTAGDLPPLAMASTRSTLVWAESSLSEAGASDLRVLADPPHTCERVSPTTAIHLPTSPSALDARSLVATEADGRTYVAMIEGEARSWHDFTLVVFDLGVCRDGG